MFSFDGVFGSRRGLPVVEKTLTYPERAVVPDEHPRVIPQLGLERSGYNGDNWEERDYTGRDYFYLPKPGSVFEFDIEQLGDNRQWHSDELNRLAVLLGNARQGRGVFTSADNTSYLDLIQVEGVTHPVISDNGYFSLTIVSQVSGKSEDFNFSASELGLESVQGIQLEYMHFDVLKESRPLTPRDKLYAGNPDTLELSKETINECYQDLIDGDVMDTHLWQSHTREETVVVSNVRFQSSEHIYRVLIGGETATAYRPQCECVATLAFEDGFTGDAELHARDFGWELAHWTEQVPMPAIV